MSINPKSIRNPRVRKCFRKFLRCRDRIRKLTRLIEENPIEYRLTEFAKLHRYSWQLRDTLARDFNFYPDRSIYDLPLMDILKDRRDRAGLPYGPIKARNKQRYPNANKNPARPTIRQTRS